MLAAVVSLLSPAYAAAPTFAGPSVAKVLQPSKFTGVSFTPSSDVTLVLMAPTGQVTSTGAVVQTDGSLSHTVVPTSVGVYILKVMDGGGVALKEVRFHVMP